MMKKQMTGHKYYISRSNYQNRKFSTYDQVSNWVLGWMVKSNMDLLPGFKPRSVHKFDRL